MDIQVNPVDEATRKQPLTADFGFGDKFSNRMFMQNYTLEKGWHDARIVPYAPFQMDPATAVLHYAQEIFEGTKAYRRADGKINLFRPWQNAKRFNKSARRMAMQTVDEEDHLTAIITLVKEEAAWVPDADGSALYIRPTLIATDKSLAVYSSNSYLHYIIVGPVGAYFAQGFAPVPVYISDQYRRAVRGGVGAAKTGGNYASSLFVGADAKEKGYSQVLWLDAIEGRFIEEVGAMNIMFVYKDKRIVTPPLSGSILAGITRDSLLTLGSDLGYTMEETAVDVHEMLADIKSGNITEVFGCGTAAVIAPVGKFGFKDEEYVINNNEVGPITQHLYDELTGIQTGKIPDRFNWIHTLE